MEEMKMDEKTFAHKKSVKPALLFCAAFTIFIGMGVYTGTTGKPAGWAVAGFFLLLI
jgi:hypothetical protein